ncbi:MAG TPA: RNA 2',3'-cyclic phosphodiesterase [Candidatus Acidoferrales bacterium]|nr:RNA 2',3'-cyclic phosphodiesterase [Candidatus Acidoferrales bacterium]
MSIRLFVALDLHEEIREAIRDLIAHLKPAGKGARWVRPESLHLTLKFIGYVGEERVEAIRSALAPVRSQRPVNLLFRGIGFFPNDKRPRVIWCGVESSTNLAPLAHAVERALEALGIPLESRDFVPHLTLARCTKPDKAPELGRAAAESRDLEFGSAQETEFHLYESILRPSGAEYRKLASFPFVEGTE